MSAVGVGEIGKSRGFYFNFLGMKRGEGGDGVLCRVYAIILFFEQCIVIGALLILMFLLLLPCFFAANTDDPLSAATITTTQKLFSRTLSSSSFRNSDCHDPQDSFKRKALAALVPVRHLDSA